MKRQQKIESIKKRSQATKDKSKQEFIELLDERVNALKGIFNQEIDINLDNLLAELKSVNSLSDSVDELNTAIKSIKLPDYPKKLKVEGIESLVTALKNSKQETVDFSPIQQAISKLDQLISKVEAIKVPENSQNPKDYIPMRRVVAIGNNFVFDDGFTGSSSSGGGGSSSSSSTGLTDAELRATPVPISGTVTADQGGTWTVQPGNTANTTAWKVDGSAVTQPVSAASLPLPTGAATSAKQDTQQTALDAIKIAVEILDNVVSGSEAQVDIVSSALPTGASTLAEQQSQTASLSVMDDWDNAASDGASVSGDVAHDAVDAGEPVKIGGKARTANPTAVAANDRVDAFFDDVGRQVTFNGVPRDLLVSPTITTITASTSETTVLAAGVAGVFHDVYGIIITNTSATATEVTFKDSTAGTSRFKISAPANDTRGITLPFVVPQSSANANWTAT